MNRRGYARTSLERIARGAMVVPIAFGLVATIAAGTAGALAPDEGPGGPILVVVDPGNAFSTYYAEILRNEGFNGFFVEEIGSVTAGVLAGYDVVVLGEMSLTSGQATMFSDWVTAGGGNLIAMRPDAQLSGLLGITAQAGTLSEAYLAIDTGSGPGAGLVGDTIQFHSSADNYSLSGATALATLYSDATTATSNPAVTIRDVGGNGGQAAAFTYDLARSVVYTRQGNPAWAGQERDGVNPIRPDDLFFGAAAGDPQPDWIDLNKVAIPQADEQQRLLANMILSMNLDRKPLPRFWYFPRMERAVVIMTGDQHSCCASTVQRFQIYETQSPPGCSVDDWECVRASSYVYANGNLSDADALSWHNKGFELGYHINTGCGNWTPASLNGNFTNQLATFASLYPSIPLPDSNRNHCIVWSDWVTQAKVSLNHGVRLDTNYYYWPPAWLQNRPGMFTGSGMVMRFADLDGTMIDVYQATSQMTDESGQGYPFTIDALLDKAIGTEGYYGAFTANMHTDTGNHAGSNAIVASAQARSVPVVSGRQMMEWLDGRNDSTFGTIAWNVNTLSFTIAPGAGSNGLRGLVPASSAVAGISTITLDGSPHAFTTETIKGVEYAVFNADAGNYVVSYLVPGDTDGDGFAPPADCNDSDDTIFPDAPEFCDAVDSDCDGQLDEDFTDLGEACSAGIGECNAAGVRVCTGNGLATECDAVPGTPVAELCDGLDNDCDGGVDEIFGDLGQACSVGIGECTTSGVKVCAAGGGDTVCDAVPGAPTTEICDGLDNDCDGATDEGTSGGSCSTGLLGACAAGTLQCLGGTPVCTPNTPATNELCNGIDDDCDGQTDEGAGGGACTTGQPGVCGPGTFACVSGVLQCQPDTGSSSETCNGLDDDCDGQVDEGNLGGGTSCSTGQSGICAQGTTQCAGGSSQCVPNDGPDPEICDGVDNDCDGQTDEGTGGASCNTGGLGVCAAGTVQCSAGSQTCEPNATASAEQCDGLDNDCDGQTDEGNPGGAASCSTGQPGICAPGTTQCQGGSVQCVASQTPQVEQCDGLDNDCDGQVDEGNPGGGASCTTGQPGVCAAGTTQCQGATLTCVANTAAGAEVCDGLDNDCDGQSDEGNPGGGATCSTGLPGACASGTQQCSGSQLQCLPDSPPRTELCDGVDNDCDGNTDEGNPEGGAACSTGQGACPSGTTQCQGGRLVCDPSGQSCDDGDACTQTDSCNGAGECVGANPVTCPGATDCAGPSTCNSTSGQCDPGTPVPAATPCTPDQNICTDDECDGSGSCRHVLDETNDPSCVGATTTTTTSTTSSTSTTATMSTTMTTGPTTTVTMPSTTTTLPSGVCAPVPRQSCFASERASFQIKRNVAPAKNQMKWKWTRGEATEQADTGDPLSTTTYALCVYDAMPSSGETLAVRVEVTPNAAWQDKAPKGWKYKDKTGAFEGVQTMQLKTGATDRSKAQLKGRGDALPMPVPATAAKMFHEDPHVVVQLINSEGRCWTSEFVGPARTNTGAGYKAKTR